MHAALTTPDPNPGRIDPRSGGLGQVQRVFPMRRRGTSVPASPAAAVDRIGPGPPDLDWTREIRSPLDLI
jgi:hypothetical protein